MLPILLLLITSTLLPCVISKSSGAPTNACSTFTPIHANIFPQLTSSPYRIRPYASRVHPEQTLKLIIESNPPNLSFGGFMIHALNSKNETVGRFNPTSDIIKLIQCSGENDTATHINPLDKINLELEWNAPSNFSGEVVFRWV